MRHAIFFFIALVGCSGKNADDPGSGPPDDAAASNGDAGPSDAGAEAATDAAPRRGHEAGVVAVEGGTDSGDSACGDMSTHEACASCCDTAHPGGHDTLFQAVHTCVCKAAHCSSACATSFCASMPSAPDAGDPCGACVHGVLSPDAGASGCGGEIASACMADDVCMAYQMCTMACGGKP
jgi:hypothetical protein